MKSHGIATSSSKIRHQASLQRAVLETVEPRRLMAAFDPTYGGNGTAEFGDGATQFRTSNSIPQLNGSVLNVSDVVDGNGTVQTRRFDAHGILDTTFGEGGTASFDLGLGAAIGGVAGASDGSVYIAGTLNDANFNSGFVVHINADGTQDLNYGNGGMAILPALITLDSGNSGVYEPHIAVASDGNVLVGYTYEPDTRPRLAVISKLDRITGDSVHGYGDNGSGSTVLTIPGVQGTLDNIVTRGSSLLLVGDTFQSPDNSSLINSSIFTAVLNAAGERTNAADSDGNGDGFGMTVVDALDHFDVDGVATTTDGGLVVGGTLSDHDHSTDSVPAFAKLDAAYKPVDSFGSHGIVTIVDDQNISIRDNANVNSNVHVDPAGNIYGVGTQDVDADNGVFNLAVIGLTPTGAMNPNVGNNGILFYNPSSNDEGGTALAYGLTSLADGSAIVAGFAASADLAPSGVLLKLTGEAAPTNHAPIVASVTSPTGATQTNQNATFTAIFSDPDVGDPLQVNWNFGDGNSTGFAPAAAPLATASHAFTAPGTYTVVFTVRDAAGLTNSGSTTVVVTAPPPVNHAPTVTSVTGPASAQTNQSAAFNATFADPDAGDSLQVSWNFGDGNTTAFAPATGVTASTTHAFGAAGTYTVAFTVKDAAGLTSTGSTTINVVNPAPPPVPYTLVNGKLSLTATAGNDTVTLTKNSAGQTVLTENGTAYVVSGTVSSIVIDGGTGNDLIRVSTQFSIPATLVGGAGNDTLRGGSGADVLLGDAGNDTLIGRDGRDLVVGGVGADLLIGSEQDDILISGTTSYASTDYASYAAIQAEWTSSRTWLLRVANLSGLIPPPGFARANGNTYLTPGVNVFDDASIDTVAGGSGNDLPLITLFGANRDVYNDGLNSFTPSIQALVNGD